MLAAEENLLGGTRRGRRGRFLLQTNSQQVANRSDVENEVYLSIYAAIHRSLRLVAARNWPTKLERNTHTNSSTSGPVLFSRPFLRLLTSGGKRGKCGLASCNCANSPLRWIQLCQVNLIRRFGEDLINIIALASPSLASLKMFRGQRRRRRERDYGGAKAD